MSGRDYRNLMRLHRDTKKLIEPSNNEKYRHLSKLVNSAHDTSLIKIQPVNYDLLKNFIAKRKNSAVKSLEKVKRFEDFSREKKEQLFIKNHLIIWLKEWYSLLILLSQAEADMIEATNLKHKSINYTDFYENNQESMEKECEYFNNSDEINEIEDYANKLNDGQIAFKVRTVHPIYDLKEDLQDCIKNNSQSMKNNPSKAHIIIETVDRVRNQQANIINKLESEANAAMLDLSEIIKQIDREDMNIEEGVPKEAFELQSPDEELRLTVLQEFIIIDFKYKQKLENIDESQKELQAHWNECWSLDNQELFQHVYDHYHAHYINIVNKNFTLRDLMFDRLQRTLVSKGFNVDRGLLLKYEKWHNSIKYLTKQKIVITNDWRESRRFLLAKAQTIFTEAFEFIHNQSVKNEQREKQLRICQQLYDKVKEWRNQKIEALEIKHKVDEMIKLKNQERNQIELEKNIQKRENEKKAIKKYKERLEALNNEQDIIDRERIDRLNSEFKERAKRDQARIDFRKEIYLDRIEKNKIIKENEYAENEEKKKRMEDFYAAVKPKVEKDYGRMVSYTEAELARRGIRKRQEGDLFVESKPLYKNFSYNDEQINSDRRLKIEARLRQAGLINSDYARALIENVKPPSEPRRDNNADSNWRGFAFGNNQNMN